MRYGHSRPEKMPVLIKNIAKSSNVGNLEKKEVTEDMATYCIKAVRGPQHKKVVLSYGFVIEYQYKKYIYI